MTATPWLGAALLALWLGFVIPAFAALYAPRSQPLPDAAFIVDWLQATGQLRSAAGAGIAVRMPAPACACGNADWAATEQALLQARLELVDLGAMTAQPTLPFELVVLDARSQLVYAGPLRFDDLCGGDGIAVAALLPGLLREPPAAFISATGCRC
ncbi:hypothetical protein [Lysobacter sp. A378]